MGELIYTPKDILALGYPSGPHIPAMVEMANREGVANLHTLAPPPKLELQDCPTFQVLAVPDNEDEASNIKSVNETMLELGKTPGVKAMAAMPDCCPAGGLGTIPVGGVVASENIHPGMHSSDVCCSVAISVFENAHPKDVLDGIHAVTHFGPGGRDDFSAIPQSLRHQIAENPFTKPHLQNAFSDMGTQGDGNHFAFVGTLKSTGQTALVTHHGSRGFGARVYKAGMRVAEKTRRKVSPETPKQNAWIEADSQEGHGYWEALQIVREWTKENHFVLHDALGLKVAGRFWNEHNFVFRKSDGLFYHGKGATPAFDNWANDATGLTLIPLNMAEPVLIARGLNNPRSLGFAPHGAGRNFSRSEHKRRGLGDFEAETAHIDARFFSGNIDLTELPSGYKNADSVKRDIVNFGLAEIVDEVLPYGCIMAGDWQKDAKWRK